MNNLRAAFLLFLFSTLSIASTAQCDTNYTAYFTAFDQGGNIAVFNGASNLPTDGFVWDFGDGNMGYGPFTQHFYQQPGSYYVCLDIWYWNQNTQDSCWASTCQMLVIGGGIDPCDSLFDANFSWVENLGTVQFTENSLNAGVQTTYYWQFGDGTSSTSQHPSHTYTQNGQYFVCMDVHTIDQNGYQCSDSLCTYITVTGLSDPCDSLLNAYFTPFQLQGNTWSFNNGTWSIDPNATFFWWDFGDGSSSTDNIPIHTFPGPGVYNVCLLAQVWNCLDTFCVSVTVPNNSNCDSTFLAGFTWSNPGGNVVVFTDASNTAGQQTYYNWSFGDGTYDYSPDPLHTYSTPGQYYVCLDTWYWNQNTQDTCWSSYCEWIVVQGGALDCDSVPHFADFTYFANTTWVNFYDQSITSGYNATYYWDFGDGNSSTDQSPLHQYATSGTYIVCLYTAIGINNGADSCFSSYCDTLWISTLGDCDSSFSAYFNYNVSNNVGFFMDMSNTAGQQTYYNWSFGDGSYDYTQNPTHTYSAPGQYYVCLDIWYWNQNTQDSCMSSYCQWVIIQGSNLDCDSVVHQAAFDAYPNGMLVNFVDQTVTSGFPATYYWDFGDGASSTDSNDLHQYAQPGTYLVCLYTAIGINNGADSCFSSICDTITVGSITNGCDSTFQASFVHTTSGNIAYFVDQSNTAGQQSFYYWSFGDGTFDYVEDPIHTYAASGQYYVCLDIWYWNQNTQDTCMSSYCQWIPIIGQGDLCDSLLEASFTWIGPGPTIQFEDLGYSGGVQTWYYWTFGDGVSSNDQEPTHTYAQSGNYWVCLTVNTVDQNGFQCTDSTCAWVFVNDQNTPCDSTFWADFTAFDQGGNIVVFNATSSIPANGFVWDMGDGSTEYGAFTQHFFQQPGTYYVCLEAWYWDQNTQDTCWTSTCQWVTVSGQGAGCDSSFVAEFSYTSSGNVAYFSDQSNTADQQTYYYWSFGDGSFDWGQDPIHTYQQAGQYFVCLEIWYWNQNTQDSCFSSYCQWVSVALGTTVDEYSFSTTPILLMPNPGNGIVGIRTDDINSKLTLLVTDVLGRSISNFSSEELMAPIDLRHLENGAYLFIFQLNEARRTERYIIEK